MNEFQQLLTEETSAQIETISEELKPKITDHVKEKHSQIKIYRYSVESKCRTSAKWQQAETRLPSK